VREREHLEAAGIGEDRAVPLRETVQAAMRRNYLEARSQVQMEGIAEDDLRSAGQLDRRSAPA
jgi:hypothetical protein